MRGRGGFGTLGLASLALGLHIWLARSVLAPLAAGGEVEYLFVSARAGTVGGSVLAAGLAVFGLHGLVRLAARRLTPSDRRPGPDLFSPADVSWARPLLCFAVSLLALGSFVPGPASVLPVLSYVVVDLRWWWTALVACWALVRVDRRLEGAGRAGIGRAAARVPAVVRRGAPVVVLVLVALIWVVAGTPRVRFSPVAHGDEPKYLRYAETLYQGVGFQISELEPPTRVPEARLWRNLTLLATELPGELRQLAADAAAFAADPSRRFNRARQLEGNFLAGKNGGTYQMHLPGLSFLMLPAYLVDRQLSGPGVRDHWPPRLRAVNTFFLAAYVVWALVIYGVLRRLAYARPVAFTATLAVALTMPMAAFPFQFYPEVAGGILLFLLLGYVVRPAGGAAAAFAAGATAGYLPWLHVRFGALALVLAVAAGLALRRDARRTWAFGIGFAVLLGCLSLYVYRITGSLLPTALYYTEDAPSALSVAGAVRSSWGYLLDRDWGVLAHAPLYLVALPGYWWLVQRRPGIGWLSVLLPWCLIVPAGGHALAAAASTPMRLIVAVVPLAAVPLAEVLSRCGARQGFRVVFGLLAVLSLHNALAYNLHHVKGVGPLVDWSFSGWKTHLLFPAASRSAWEVSAANGGLLILWFLVLAVLVAAPALAAARARRGSVGPTGTRRLAGAGAGAFVAVTAFVLLGTGVAAATGSWGDTRYRVPAETAAWEAAGLLDRIDHCALCLSSRRGPIGTAGLVARLTDHGVYPRLCGGEAVVRLRARSGRFLSVRRFRARADADVAERQERFALLDPNGGCVDSGDVVFLRTADGYYLRSYGDTTRVDGRGLATGPWARFVVVGARRGDGIRRRDTITLRTPGGQYVATRGSSGALRASRTRVDRDAWFALTVEE